MWIIFFLGATGFCSYLVFQSVSNYLQFDVVTKIQIFKESTVDFPVVSFCNNNVFAKNVSYDIINGVIKTSYNQTFDAYYKSLLNNTFFNADNSIYYLKPTTLFKIFGPMYTNDDKKGISYSIDEMLLGCIYNQIPCNSSEFSWYIYMSFYLIKYFIFLLVF